MRLKKKELSALEKVKESPNVHSVVDERIWTGQAAEQDGPDQAAQSRSHSVQTPAGCKVAFTWQRNNLAVDVVAVLPGGRIV